MQRLRTFLKSGDLVSYWAQASEVEIGSFKGSVNALYGERVFSFMFKLK